MNRNIARFAAPLALVLLVNGVVLAGVAWNRSGPPEATLLLTERELPLSWNFSRDENSGIGLTMQLCRDCNGQSWFNQAKLTALGFEPEGFLAQDVASRKWPLPRRAYAVIEFDGPLWEKALERKRRKVEAAREQLPAGEESSAQLQAAEQGLRRMQQRGSRLVPVDAGNDPQALRERYPDRTRYLITPAQVRMYRCSGKNCEDPVYGQVGRILTGSIHVPVQYHGVFAGGSGSEPPRGSWRSFYYRRDVAGPRYRVKLHFGKRYEPWIAEIEPIVPEARGSGS